MPEAPKDGKPSPPREGGSSAATESPLEMARRHVRRGEAHIVRQREIVAKLADGGHPTDAARDFLALLETTQRAHEAHLAALARGRSGT